jgi:hypothetical protein
VFDPAFAIFYSLGGAVAMPFVEPLIWVPALVIGRNSPRCTRFWCELPIGMITAFFIGWHENGFASMASLDSTVKSIQFIRPAIAVLLSSLLASLLWTAVRGLVTKSRA